MSNNLVCLFYSFNDGMLEVMGIYSSFHIAQLQVGLADPIRLGQAKIVKVRAHSASLLKISARHATLWESAKVLQVKRKQV